MQSIQINSVIVSRDGLMHGVATGQTRKCCVDCKTHSRSCQVLWEGAGLGWVCMGTLVPRTEKLNPPVYQVVSVQEGIDYLGSHGEDGGVVTDDRLGIVEMLSGMLGWATTPAIQGLNVEYVEFAHGDLGTNDPKIAAWIDEAQALVRKDWKA